MRFTRSILFSTERFYLLVLVIIAFVMMLPIALYGIPNGNDLPQHYQFAQAFYEALTKGTIYPHLFASANEGLGDYGIRFYPPLPYFVLSLARILVGNWYDASYLTFSFWMILGSVGAYLWAREYLPGNSAIVAGILYAIVPYRCNEIYNAFTYGEFVGAAVLPFAFWMVMNVCHKGRVIDIIGLAISYAALILSHLPLTVIGSLSLFVFALTFLNLQNFVYTGTKLILSVLLGLAASSFYWMMMVTEMAWLNHTTQKFISASYDYQHNFLLAFNYFFDAEIFARNMWFGDLTLLASFSLFIPFAILGFSDSHPTKKSVLRKFILLFFFALLMSTPLSRPLWDNLTFLQKVQFPWRWLAIISLTGAVIAASGLESFVTIARNHSKRFIALIVSGCILFGLTFTFAQIIRQANYKDRANFEQQIDSLPTEKSFECWWTIWAKPSAFENKERVSADSRSVVIDSWESENRLFTVEQGLATTARVATFYYPHWRADVNGQAVELKCAEDGVMLIPLPPERANVRLRFQEPVLLKTSSVVSAGTWLFIFAGLFSMTFLAPRLKSLFDFK